MTDDEFLACADAIYHNTPLAPAGFAGEPLAFTKLWPGENSITYMGRMERAQRVKDRLCEYQQAEQCRDKGVA